MILNNIIYVIHIIIMLKTTVHSIGGVVRKSAANRFPNPVLLSGKVRPAPH